MEEELIPIEYSPNTFNLNVSADEQYTGISGTQDEIEFFVNETTLLRLCANGDIYVKEKLVENDKHVVDGLREFLKKVNGLI